MSTLEKKHTNRGLLLGITGALFIATGILMIPGLTEQKLEQLKKETGQGGQLLQENPLKKQENPSAEKKPDQKNLIKETADDHDNNVLNNKQIQNKKSDDLIKKTDSDVVKASNSDIKQNGQQNTKWTLVLDEKTYSLTDNANLIITRIVNAIKADPKASIKISGINSSRKSSKRALHAASVVSDKLKELVQNKTLHIKQSALQTSDATGIKVSVELEKEDK